MDTRRVLILTNILKHLNYSPALSIVAFHLHWNFFDHDVITKALTHRNVWAINPLHSLPTHRADAFESSYPFANC